MLSSFLATTTGLARDGLAAGHSRGLAGIGAEFPAMHMDERLVPAVLSHHAARLSIKPTDNICYSGVTATTDPLLRGLLDSGLARPDSLRLGIEADARGALLNVSGTASDVVFTLGPPLRGQLYETTAIPETRDQAAALAGPLLAACHAHAAPLAASGTAGSAA